MIDLPASTDERVICGFAAMLPCFDDEVRRTQDERVHSEIVLKLTYSLVGLDLDA